MSGGLPVIPCFTEILALNANSLDPNHTSRSAASDLGQRCLPMLFLWDVRHKWVNGNKSSFRQDNFFKGLLPFWKRLLLRKTFLEEALGAGTKTESPKFCLPFKQKRQNNKIYPVTLKKIPRKTHSHQEHPITKTRLFKYTENFTIKTGKFSEKKFWHFSYFCSKHRLWVLVRTASPRRF